MPSNNKHYSARFPDVDLKVYTISESLRRHLYIFKTTTGVFSYRKIDLGTKILIEHMDIPEGVNTLLDLGCGYGPIGIVLGYVSSESQVYFVDINKRAIWCVKENIKINLPHSKDRLHIYAGHYFEPFKNKHIKFDAIYMNPPIRRGREEFLNLFDTIQKYLKENGFFEFVMRKKLGASYVYDYLIENYSKEQIQVNYKRSGYWIFQCFLN